MKKNGSVLKIVSILFFAAIVIYIGVNIYRALDDPFETAAATAYTVRQGTEVRGMAVRNEEWLIYTGGIASVTAQNGSRIAAGGEVAAVYADTEALRTAEQIDALTTQQAQLLLLKSGGESADNVLNSDLEIKNTIRSLRDAMQLRELSGISGMSVELSTLVRNESGSQEDIDAQLSEINSRLQKLGSETAQRLTTIYAAASGIFTSDTDGWESVSPDSIASMKPSALRSLMDEGRTGPNGAVGKLVYGNTWYFAALVPQDTASSMYINDSVEVSFGRWMSQDVYMNIEYVSGAEDGYCVVMLSCDKYMADAASLRVQTAELIESSFDGIRVPRKALHTDGTENFVYVVTGLQAEKKTVNILLDSGDYYVVEAEFNRADALHAGDAVIVSGKGLYDGKVVE